MSIPELCEQLQDLWVSRAISESTWGYPIVGALHVLAFALFGGSLLVPDLRDDVRWIRRIGMTLVVLTGSLLFASGAAGYYRSTSFRIKMVLLTLLAANALGARKGHIKLRSAISLALWIAVIFAARGIAFY